MKGPEQGFEVGGRNGAHGSVSGNVEIGSTEREIPQRHLEGPLLDEIRVKLADDLDRLVEILARANLSPEQLENVPPDEVTRAMNLIGDVLDQTPTAPELTKQNATRLRLAIEDGRFDEDE